jgi:hypothetical protein
MPACASYFGWTDVPGTTSTAVQVLAREPFDPLCGSTAPVTQVVGDVVPLVAPQARVPHAAVGPIDALRTLAGG